MFKRILVPLDGSKLAECVLPHLVAIARIGEPEVQLVRVLQPFDGVIRMSMVDPVEWQIRKAEAESYLSGLAAVLQDAGLRISIRLEEGRPAELIIAAAHDWDADLILMSSHGRSGLSPWCVSSVVEHVILLAHRTVMIVRAYQPVKAELTELRYHKILLPLDGSQRAELSLSVAEALVREHQCELLIAHVVQQPQPPRRTSPLQEDITLIHQLTERSQEEALKYMIDLKSRLAVDFETRLEISSAVPHALHQIADEQDVDLLILSAHGHSGDTRWPYGSVVTGFIVYGGTTLLILQDLPIDRIEPTRAEIAARETESR
jgi:nucleotide-binding universal stress UspA family protein